MTLYEAELIPVAYIQDDGMGPLWWHPAVDEDGIDLAATALVTLSDANEAIKAAYELGKRDAMPDDIRKDAERLDYLQQGVTIDLWGKELLFRVGGLYSTLNKSIREAIDAATKEK